MRSVNFRLSELEVELLDRMAKDQGLSRTDLLRKLITLGRERWLYRREAAAAFIARLEHDLDPEATIVVQLDDQFDPYARLDDGTPLDLYLPVEVVSLGGEDFVKIYLGDPASDVRLLLGVLPFPGSAVLAVDVQDLDPKMLPRAVAYFPDEQ